MAAGSISGVWRSLVCRWDLSSMAMGVRFIYGLPNSSVKGLLNHS